MRLIPAKLATHGMRLGRSVLDSEGRLILAAGFTLRQRYIDLLVQQGYTSLYVADDLEEVELPELVTVETRREVMSCIMEFTGVGKIGKMGKMAATGQAASTFTAQAMAAGKTKARPDVTSRLARVAQMLVDEIISRPEVVIGLLDIKSLHDYTFAHSVQVALVAMASARVLGYNRKDLLDLGMGTLLHDVGKVAVDESLWNKKERLDNEEYEVVKTHTTAGFDFLRKANVGLLPAHVALQHHERWNGSGYPRGLREQEILKHARLCAVCDVFDAITSDRPYKQALHPSEALAFISENAGSLFDPEMVDALHSVIAPYPVATSVLLSTGETAVVKRINYRALDRPLVVLTKDPQNRYYKTRRDIDLSEVDEVTITGYVSWQGEGAATDGVPGN